MRKIIMILFMIVCFCTISNAKEPEKVKNKYITDINDFISQEDFTEDSVTGNVNIRTTPNMDDNIYTVVEKNDKLLVKNTRNGWTEVYFDEYVFYVDTSYLKETNKSEKEQVEEKNVEQKIEEKIEPKVDIRVDNGYRYYSIYDCYPDENLEKYLYQQLTNRGIAWYYPYAIAQIYQESNWNPNSTNGRDHGLCQFKGIYWDNRAALAGLPGADIWNPYDSLYVYAWFMAGLLNGRSVDWALSLYITGVEGQYHSEYVNYVLTWYNSLR